LVHKSLFLLNILRDDLGFLFVLILILNLFFYGIYFFNKMRTNKKSF